MKSSNIRHLRPPALNQQVMDYYNSFKNTLSRNKPVAFAATAAALGVGYAYYYTRTANIPLATKATAVLLPEGDSNVAGTIVFVQTARNSPVTLMGNIRGLPPNAKRGFHIHQWGDLTKGCASAGPHFNPYDQTHGAPSDKVRHVGDLGNIQSNDKGEASLNQQDSVISLNGTNSIIGRAIVIHARTDDHGRGGDVESLKTGNSGARVACGVIGLADTK